VNNTARYKWRLAKGNWEKFTDQIEQKLPTEYERMSVKKLEKIFRETILKAAKKHIRKKKINAKTRIDLGDEVKQEAAHRNKMRTEIDQAENEEERKSIKKEWIESSRRVAEMTKEERGKKWKEYIEGIDPKTSSSKVWQTIRNLEGKNSRGGKTDTLVVNDKAYITDKDKANQFAKTYKGFSKLEVRKEDRTIRKEVRKAIKRRTTVIEESEQEITMTELERSIEESKKGKAAGEDDIPYEMLQNLGPKAKRFLVHLYNEVWKGKELPKAWRTAIIKPLLKDGKDPKETVSYRPISLTSCVGKILERIVADRLMYILECRGVINDNQAGFRQNRATTDQVLKLIQSASDQLHSTAQNKSTICTFFDYEKAYDKVWRDGLMHKMVEMGVPGRFLRYVRHFLSGRVTTAMVNGVKSKKFRLNEGLPQGSCISPLLFLIFINDIDAELHPDTLVSLFADDTAIWCQAGKNIEENIERMQEEIDKIWKWAKKWKMKINEGKTKALVISTKPADISCDPGLKLNGKEVQAVEYYKFLGIQADNGIRFKKTVNDSVKKNTERVNIMRCLATKEWGQSLESQRATYMTYIRSCLEYGSPSWWSWIPKTSQERLERVQNAALRATAGLSKGCPVDFLRLETGVEPLHLRMKKNDAITLDKYQRMPDKDPRKQTLERDVKPRLKTRLGWRHHAQKFEVCKSVNRPDQQPSPWTQFSNLSIEKVTLEKRKAEYTAEELRQLSIDKINTFVVNYRIYTDGSTDGNQRNGGAGTYIEDANGRMIDTFEEPAGAYCSSYGGECVAMLRACTWIKEKEDKEGEQLSILIATDSESLVNSLKNRSWKIQDEWLKKIKKTLAEIRSTITVLWIPSHCDIEGNEKADDLANKGRTKDQNNVPVTQAIVKAKIKAEKWEPTHERAREVFKDRLKPKFEVESKWTRRMRSLFARLRTDHAKELANYQHKIGNIDSPNCTECNKPETIKHVLCECVKLEEKRVRMWHDTITVSMMTTHPELCRRILEHRFPALQHPRPRSTPTTPKHM